MKFGWDSMLFVSCNQKPMTFKKYFKLFKRELSKRYFGKVVVDEILDKHHNFIVYCKARFNKERSKL